MMDTRWYHVILWLAVENLRTQALQISKTSFQINLITGTYLDVSQNHLVKRLVSLDKLLSYDPSKQHNEIKE